jgi:hypothetical protein
MAMRSLRELYDESRAGLRVTDESEMEDIAG